MSESVRNTALKNAIMRTTRFENVTINGITQILTDLTSSFYRVAILRNNKTSVIEILNYQIVSVNAAEPNEIYSINGTNFIVELPEIIDGTGIISVEYYESFKFEVISDGGENSISHGIQNLTLTEYYVRSTDTSFIDGIKYYESNISNNGITTYTETTDNTLDNETIYYNKVILDQTNQYFQPVHAENVYAENLNISNVKTNVLECSEIMLGKWKITSGPNSKKATISKMAQNGG